MAETQEGGLYETPNGTLVDAHGKPAERVRGAPRQSMEDKGSPRTTGDSGRERNRAAAEQVEANAAGVATAGAAGARGALGGHMTEEQRAEQQKLQQERVAALKKQQKARQQALAGEKVARLRDLARSYGLDASGTKQELAKRIGQYEESQQPPVPDSDVGATGGAVSPSADVTQPPVLRPEGAE